MPKVARDRRDLMRLMAASRMPPALYYVSDRTAARLGDAMFVSMLLISELIEQRPNVAIERQPLNDTAIIAGYPAAAFDLHTYEGRTALRRLGHRFQPLADETASLTPTMREVALRHGVFIAEGGLLANQVRFLAADMIERQAQSAELAFASLTDSSSRARFLDHIRKAEPHLDRLRSETLQSGM